MAFRRLPPTEVVPDSPEKILLQLPRRKIPGVLLHQGQMMQAYVARAYAAPDVALQLPTGSGKTLVGLLIAEWRRRKNRERVVYLCPTRQLVNQVVEQAEEQYGLSVLGFTGPKVGYSPEAKAGYQAGDRVAVTTYNSLFNSNPFRACKRRMRPCRRDKGAKENFLRRHIQMARVQMIAQYLPSIFQLFDGTRVLIDDRPKLGTVICKYWGRQLINPGHVGQAVVKLPRKSREIGVIEMRSQNAVS